MTLSREVKVKEQKMAKTKKLTLFEMAPRDGLQNEPNLVSLRDKKFLISGLAKAGCHEIEIGAMVRSDLVPQMASTDELLEAGLFSESKSWVLVPNEKGLERALESGAKAIAVFTAASETFNKKNIGMSITESFDQITSILALAKKKKLRTRAYISTVFGCPFEGEVNPSRVFKLVETLGSLGVESISLGDTIGVATPKSIERIFGVLKKRLTAQQFSRLAFHGHDTWGMAVANCLRAYELGVRQFDSSAGGLGGCPFAPGATGNVATEDLVYLFEKMGIKTGIDLEKLCELSAEFSRRISKPLSSKTAKAFLASREQRK